MSNQRAVYALGLIVVILVGVLAFALTSMRNFMQLQYLECQDRLAFDMAANESRTVQTKEFRRLGIGLTAIAGDTPHGKSFSDSFEQMAVAQEAAVAKAVTPDCERLKPPTLGDVVAGERYIIGGG